jgi:hypothetical protein
MGVKCNDLTYTIVNALTIRVGGGTRTLTAHKVDGVIHSLEGPEGVCISLGLTMEIRRIKYKINLIEQRIIGGILVYELSVAKRTKSYTYILPMMGPGKELFMIDKLVNVFIKTQKNDDCIALLYRFSADPLFLQLEKAFKQFSYFREIEDVDPYHVLFVFNIPNKYRRIYNQFINGEYSKFSQLYKLHVLEFFDLNKHSQVCQILFKTEKRRKLLEEVLGTSLPEDSELYSIIDERETYDPKIYKPKKLL